MNSLTLDQPAPKSQRISFFLANGLLLFTLFPYISPVPMSSDIQLMASVLGIVTILAWIFVERENVKVGWAEAGIFAMAAVYLFYVTPIAWNDFGEVIRKSSTMMLGFFIYLATKFCYHLFSIKVVMFAAVAHLAAAAIQALSPDAHHAVIAPFMGQMRVAEDRGVGGACPEPSFLANIAVLLPIAAWVVGGNGGGTLSKKGWIFLWIIVVSLIGLSQAATASVYGIAILLVFGLARGLRSGFITVAAITACGFVLVAAGPSMKSSRATEIVSVAVSNPRLIIEDPSASMRLVGHYLAGPSLVEKPFGNGQVKFDHDYFWFLWNKYNIDSWYEVDVSRLSGQWYAVAFGLTDFGAGCFRMGWVFIFILVFWLLQYRGGRYSPAVITFVALGVLSSIPIVFPAFWWLLGCLQAERDRPANLETSPQTL